MAGSIKLLADQGLPFADADDLPASSLRFPDGRAWRLEIPSVEGPTALQVVIDEARRWSINVDRISQGSGIMMLTASELRAMTDLGTGAGIEVCLFVGPRAAWDVGRQPLSSAGAVAGPTLRGGDQLRYAVEDIRRGIECGIRSVLIGDVGLLAVVGRAKAAGDLPADLVVKTSVALPCTNPATARLYEEIGATSLNLGTDLSLAQIAAIRQAVSVPLDVYCEAPDDFGGAVRHYEVVDLVRVAAPVYIKYTVRNSPGIYPSGQQLEGVVLSSARERVRRAALGIELLTRYST
jgi:hypothetical protein